MGRRRSGHAINGWLNIDKAEDVTSTEVVNAIKRLLKPRKVGHAGTLDPIATGVLPIALGEATKTVPYVQDAGKTYRFTVRWGERRNTDDREGEVTARSGSRPDPAAIEAVLASFTGDIQQVPPQFSAVKVQGERAYDLARAGESLTLASRPATVYSLALVDVADGDHASFTVRSGKGFYVRALARDLGEKLGCYGHVTELERVAVGGFHLANAVSSDDLMAMGHDIVLSRYLLPVETALDDIPALALTDQEACQLRNGQPVALLRRQDRDRLERFRADRDRALADTDDDAADRALATCQGRPIAIVAVEGASMKPVRILHV